MATFGILVGGGPAPGINGVIGAATILARRSGARVLGLVDGFQWLMKGDATHSFELRIAQVSRVHLLGGSILQTSRANPTKKPEDFARCVAEQAAGKIRVAHVPKTIDNDLPLPGGIPTFGFETAREHATRIVSHLMEDARTSQRWFFVVMMGRTAGHLALGAAKAAGATLALIPEDFAPGPIRLAAVVRILEGAIVKRVSMGRGHGVAVIAEGVGARLEPSDLEALASAPRDEHGHVRLAEVPLGAVLRDAVRAGLAELGISMTIVEKDVGYELRCAPPNAFDLDYTRDLGVGAVRALLGGASGVMITRQGFAIVPVPFDELMDPKTHKTRVRLVDVATESHTSARSLQVRIERADLDDAERLEQLAAAAGLTPAAARERWASVL